MNEENTLHIVRRTSTRGHLYMFNAQRHMKWTPRREDAQRFESKDAAGRAMRRITVPNFYNRCELVEVKS